MTPTNNERYFSWFITIFGPIIFLRTLNIVLSGSHNTEKKLFTYKISPSEKITFMFFFSNFVQRNIEDNMAIMSFYNDISINLC